MKKFLYKLINELNDNTKNFTRDESLIIKVIQALVGYGLFFNCNGQIKVALLFFGIALFIALLYSLYERDALNFSNIFEIIVLIIVMPCVVAFCTAITLPELIPIFGIMCLFAIISYTIAVAISIAFSPYLQ